MTMATIVNILTGFFEAIVILMFIDSYARRNSRKSLYVYVAAVFLHTFFVVLSNLIFHFGVFNILFLTVYVFIESIIFLKEVKSSLAIATVSTAILSITEVLTLSIMMVMLGVTAEQVANVESYRVMGTIFSKLLAFIAIKIICLRNKENRVFAVKTSYWILFSVILGVSILAICLLYMFQYYSVAPGIYNTLAVWCSFGLLYNTFFCLYLYEKMAKQAVKEQKQEMFRQQIKAQAKHIDEILINQKEIKKLRHDLKNHHIAIKAYLQKQDYTGGMDYLERMWEKAECAKEFIETGNVSLDAILNTKRNIAISCGIIFETRLQIPEKLFIDPVDLCIIFGNALDNAIEACERVQGRERRIDVSITYAEGALLCKITNTATKQGMDNLRTVKKNKENHGFGIGNIETALANYNSIHHFSQNEKEFTFACKIFCKKE